MISDAMADDAWLNMLYDSYTTLLLIPQASKTDAMDLWVNVKISFLDPQTNQSNDTWRDVFWSSYLGKYSSLAEIPVSNVSVGNTTFSLESSYTRLDCERAKAEKSPKKSCSPLKWKYDVLDGEIDGYWRSKAFKYGSWNGFSFYEPEFRASWGLGLDRFVDDLSIPELDSPVTPAIFENETGIEAGPTRLLFQVEFNTRLGYGAQFSCDVRQEYVESRVNCSRSDGSANHYCWGLFRRKGRPLIILRGTL